MRTNRTHRTASTSSWLRGYVSLFSLCLLTPLGSAQARVVVLANGFELSGKTANVSSIGADMLSNSSDKGSPITVVDDGLRRSFVAKLQVVDLREEPDSNELLRLTKNDPAVEGIPVGRVAAILGVTPFNEHGRRTLTLQARDQRKLNIIQGITQVTPVWTRVQGLKSEKSYRLDMRIATETIPRETLLTVLKNHLNFKDPDVRLSLVRMFIQAEQFGAAEKELDQAIKDFPDLKAMKQELRTLRQLKAKQQLAHIERQQSTGQHFLARTLLNKFPDEGIAQESLLTVSEMIAKYDDDVAQGKIIVESIQAKIAKIGNAQDRQLYDSFYRELFAELNHNTLPRLAPYVRSLENEEMPDDQKLAVALSGWILDGNATENLAVATSTWQVREVIKDYLVSTDAQERKQLIESLGSEEAGAPKYVAEILAAMKPPKRTEGLVDRLPEENDGGANAEVPAADNDPDKPTALGHFVIETTGLNQKMPVTYHVQLPPEYDANRRYPAMVSLHGAGGKPENQITWWAGAYNKDVKMRVGQASQEGYIVIAPQWTYPKQRRYEYSARENAAVMASLRDACQRFSIDTDRVFLSGHSMGGDAAWDIALAHPDLWAGVVPIGAISEYDGKTSPQYVNRCWRNAKALSLYFVHGALDKSNLDANAVDFNRYFKTSGYDAIVVEYLGRGHEHFHEEIKNIFRWMKIHERDPAPEEISATIMRPWDNFYWWLEFTGVPQKSVVLPEAWPPAKGVRPMEITGRIRERKNIRVTTGTSGVRIFLTPDMVDLDQDVSITVGSNTRKIDPKPSAETILEDARRRGDRKRPFWVELELPTGRGR